MGNVAATERLQRLLDLGFSVEESRLALEATSGDVDAAIAILMARRKQANQHKTFAERINYVLKQQRPWGEFFERFLWPEHFDERVRTNLFYYRANYLVLSLGLMVVAVLSQPALLLLAILNAALLAAALCMRDDEPLPFTSIVLDRNQRVGAVGLSALASVNSSGHASTVCRVLILCAGLILAHATFRARSISARWSFFKAEAAEKLD